jgi:hypothetical protein
MAKNLFKLSILFILIGSTGIVQAQKLKGIGLNGGYIIPVNNIQNGFSVETRLDFGEVLKYVFLFPSLSYWQIQEQSDVWNLKRKHINFGVNFLGYINPKARGFYGGAGIHYHVISAEEPEYKFSTTNPDIKSKKYTKLGLSLVIGYLVPFKKVSIYLEPGYTYLHGGFNTLQVRLGLYYKP